MKSLKEKKMSKSQNSSSVDKPKREENVKNSVALKSLKEKKMSKSQNFSSAEMPEKQENVKKSEFQ